MSNLRAFNVDRNPDDENISLLQKYLPNFSYETFTFRVTVLFIKVLQVFYFILSLILGENGQSPSMCSLLILGAKVYNYIVFAFYCYRL